MKQKLNKIHDSVSPIKGYGREFLCFSGALQRFLSLVVGVTSWLFRIILASFAVTAKESEAQSISLQEPIGAWGFTLPSSSTLIVQFKKRSQPFISVHHETLSVVAVRINNPDCSRFQING